MYLGLLRHSVLLPVHHEVGGSDSGGDDGNGSSGERDGGRRPICSSVGSPQASGRGGEALLRGSQQCARCLPRVDARSDAAARRACHHAGCVREPVAPAPAVVASTVRAAALLLKPCQRPQDRSFSERGNTLISMPAFSREGRERPTKCVGWVRRQNDIPRFVRVGNNCSD